MNKCHMKSTDKVEVAKQAIREIMEEHQLSDHKPIPKHLLGQLLSQLASFEEEDFERLSPEVDGREEKPKERWDSSQEEDFERVSPEVDGTEEKPKERWDLSQEEDFERLSPEVDGTEEKPKERWDSSQEVDSETLCPEVDGTEEKPKEHLDSSQEEDVGGLSPEVDKTEEIIKELRNVKRQNVITHCLVSTMILLTLAWQISEVSLLLKLKKGLKNPFQFFGGIIKSLILKGDRPEEDGEQSDDKEKHGVKPPLIKLPDLNLLDLPIFDSSDGE